ncbi:MAG TPA: hypothetical protein VF408_03880 [Sediminibacterium sp.]|jgi:hypothetical protein
MPADNELVVLEKMDPRQLAEYVNGLIATDFPRLVQLLYRLDVSEEKLKAALAAHTGIDAGILIAQLLAERIEQSRKTRQMFRADGDIPEEEKW